MHKLFSLLITILFSAKLFSQENSDYLGITGFTFNETKYILTNSSPKSKIQIVQDYISEEERIEDASNVISLYFFNKDIDAKEAAYHKTEELENRKDSDKFSSYNVTENPNGTEFIVDFFTSNIPKNKEQALPEQETSDYNIYRFKNVLIGGKPAFIIIAYKEKFDGDTKSFIKTIGKKRDKLMEGIITLNLPAITLKTN